jgi:hypothetical protein
MGLLQRVAAHRDALHDKYPTVPIEALHLAFPVAAGAMLVRFVLSEESALYFAICVLVARRHDAGQLVAGVFSSRW